MGDEWEKELDDSIWPAIWPDQSKYGRLRPLYQDNETSIKQLEYLHIYLYHNKLNQKQNTTSYPKPYTPKSLKHWSNYFGYEAGRNNCTVLARNLTSNPKWTVFNTSRAAFLDCQTEKVGHVQ